MSKRAANSRPSASARAKPSSAPVAQKRKRVQEEEDEDDATQQLDAMLALSDDEDEEEEEEDDGEDGSGIYDEDDEDLDIDPQEIAAMQHLYGKKKKQRKSADDMDDNDDDEEDEEMDGVGGGEDSSEDDGEEAGDEGTGTIARPAKKKLKTTYLDNRPALLDKLNDMKLPASYPWIETLQLTTNKSFAQATDNAPDAVHDDLKREAAFYELSLTSATQGLQQLTDLHIPYRIPNDFFAERVKPDKHMSRIKDKLIEEQRKMVAVSERKLDKETRKFAKKVQANKLLEKSAEKKTALAQAGKMRKAEGADKELSIERSILPGVQQHIAANKAEEAARREKKSAKREAKDKKFGHGGKKRHSKSNSKESNSDSKGFNLGKMRENFDGFKDQKPGSYQERRSNSDKGKGTYNKNGSQFASQKKGGPGGSKGFARGGKGKGGGTNKGKPNRPGKASRAQSRK